ncbi:MAG: long-chain-fatty-acid--CoA ligase [Gammaproteobacteria bacterium]
MLGLMMDLPLTLTTFMRHGERNHGGQEIVSVTHDHPRHRYTYRDCFARVRRLARAIDRLGAGASARIATLAWNDFRHLELYYAISCSGRVCHTINPRLFEDQITYIVNHAEDEWIFVDPAFVPRLEQIAASCPAVKGYVVLADAAHMPKTSLPNVLCYETLVMAEPDTYEWPSLDERRASGLCYTSGTTGNPKGVLYDHRSACLMAYASALPDSCGLSAVDGVLPIVPMFHVNAWGLPFSAVMVGAKIVFPGPALSNPGLLTDLITQEGVTLSAGVPTVCLPLLAHARETGRGLAPLNRMVIGGSACPLSMMEEFRDRHGVRVIHAWGMTEMSPLGTINAPTPQTRDLQGVAAADQMCSQGRAIPGVELKITDDEDRELPWDGRATGALKVRGWWVCRDYFRLEGAGGAHADGWFTTGDVASIDQNGFMRITDRAKDVIKSGGEWISSIDLENTAMGHPAVAEAAVIGVAHPKWQERPLLVVVRKPGVDVQPREILEWFDGRVARWWIPEDVVFVASLPHTATGKLSKLELRKQLADYRFPGT